MPQQIKQATINLLIPFVASVLLYASVANAKNEHHKHKQAPEQHQYDNHLYKKQTKSLPYGLQKKLKRGKPLPPGWQKKLKKGDILSDDLFHRGDILYPINKNGEITITIEDIPIRINEKTRKIIEIIDIISN